MPKTAGGALQEYIVLLYAWSQEKVPSREIIPLHHRRNDMVLSWLVQVQLALQQ